MFRRRSDTYGANHGRRAACQSLLAGSALALASCGRSNQASETEVREVDALEAARLYGNAPERGGDIQFQPDVKIVGDGARSIRALSADGLSWLLDAGARDIERVRVGDILLVTGSCAGRVHALVREGDSVKVTLGPAGLTEVIRECHIETEQTIDFDQTRALVARQLPGSNMTLDSTLQWPDDETVAFRAAAAWSSDRSSMLTRRALFNPAVDGRYSLRHISQGPNTGDLRVNPVVNSEGISMTAEAKNAFMHMYFTAGLRFGAPRLHCVVHILPNGVVREASLGLSGAAGLRIGFVAATSSEGDVSSNINKPGELIPVDFNIPVLGLGVLGACVQQRFLIKSAFSAKKSYLKAIGDYGVAGELSFGYRNGAFGTSGPKIQTINNSLLDSTGGLSVGVNGMVLTHQVRCLVGIGMAGFRVGPYVALNNSIGITRGSDLALPVQPIICKMAKLVMHVRPGIGYQLPELFTDAVNVALGLFGAGKLKSSDGIETEAVQIFERTAYAPETKACRVDSYGDTVAPNSGSGGGGGGPPLSDPPRRPPTTPPQGSGATPHSEGGAIGGDAGALDPSVICPDREARRRLQEAGVDIEEICSASNREI